VTEPTPSERLQQALFSTQGVIDTLVGPLVFLALYRASGLNTAVAGAGGVALAVLGWRMARGQPATTAGYGVAGVFFGALLAKATGSGDGFFLPKVASNAFYGTAFLVSAVIGRPLVGIVWALFHGQSPAWGWRPQVRRVFAALTLLWAAGYYLRAVVYVVLIADDEDRTGALTGVSVGLGLPLTGALLATTIVVARRALGPEARPAEGGGPATPEPV
jgi:hypothetical protein